MLFPYELEIGASYGGHCLVDFEVVVGVIKDSVIFIIRSINVSSGNGGSHGIVVNGNGPVLINSIAAGSPAEEAGLKMYDFIIKV